MNPLSVDDFKTRISADSLLLDTRPAHAFTRGFIPGSVNIELENRFADWAGRLLSSDKPILLITEHGKEEESINQLTGAGFELVQGYFSGGFEGWQEAGEEIDMIINVDPDELLMDMPHDPNLVVLDVRKKTEFAGGHLPDAINMPLESLTDPGNMAHIEDGLNLYIHCAGDNRSVMAASLLKRQGFHNLRNVSGGWNAIREQKNVKVIKEKNNVN